ncbi:nucleotidyltransferase family protein, partial [Rhodococcus rhodnii]
MSQSIADPGAGRAVVGAVLAAGAGRRFGGPKALVRLDGERLVDRAASLLRDGGCDEIVVVSGAAPLEVAGADVVHNPDWESGMGSSLRTAIDAALARDVAALVVTLVDLPWLGPDAVARVLDAARRGAAVAAATYD